MDVTSKDILNLTCAVKIAQTACKSGYYVLSGEIRDGIESALRETINKYKNSLKESKEEQK